MWRWHRPLGMTSWRARSDGRPCVLARRRLPLAARVVLLRAALIGSRVDVVAMVLAGALPRPLLLAALLAVRTVTGVDVVAHEARPGLHHGSRRALGCELLGLLLGSRSRLGDLADALPDLVAIEQVEVLPLGAFRHPPAAVRALAAAAAGAAMAPATVAAAATTLLVPLRSSASSPRCCHHSPPIQIREWQTIQYISLNQRESVFVKK